MKKMVPFVAATLQNMGLFAPEIEIRRACWRSARMHPGGMLDVFGRPPIGRASWIASYLELNQIARRAK
jgi:hypothetical protein